MTTTFCHCPPPRPHGHIKYGILIRQWGCYSSLWSRFQHNDGSSSSSSAAPPPPSWVSMTSFPVARGCVAGMPPSRDDVTSPRSADGNCEQQVNITGPRLPALRLMATTKHTMTTVTVVISTEITIIETETDIALALAAVVSLDKVVVVLVVDPAAFMRRTNSAQLV